MRWLFALVVVGSACGGGKTTAKPDAAAPASCTAKADCETGNVCCTEPADQGGGTSCRPTCVTNAPRDQVCKTDAECQSGTCQQSICR